MTDYTSESENVALNFSTLLFAGVQAHGRENDPFHTRANRNIQKALNDARTARSTIATKVLTLIEIETLNDIAEDAKKKLEDLKAHIKTPAAITKNSVEKLQGLLDGRNEDLAHEISRYIEALETSAPAESDKILGKIHSALFALIRDTEDDKKAEFQEAQEALAQKVSLKEYKNILSDDLLTSLAEYNVHSEDIKTQQESLGAANILSFKENMSVLLDAELLKEEESLRKLKEELAELKKKKPDASIIETDIETAFKITTDRIGALKNILGNLRDINYNDPEDPLTGYARKIGAKSESEIRAGYEAAAIQISQRIKKQEEIRDKIVTLNRSLFDSQNPHLENKAVLQLEPSSAPEWDNTVAALRSLVKKKSIPPRWQETYLNKAQGLFSEIRTNPILREKMPSEDSKAMDPKVFNQEARDRGYLVYTYYTLPPKITRYQKYRVGTLRWTWGLLKFWDRSERKHLAQLNKKSLENKIAYDNERKQEKRLKKALTKAEKEIRVFTKTHLKKLTTEEKEQFKDALLQGALSEECYAFYKGLQEVPDKGPPQRSVLGRTFDRVDSFAQSLDIRAYALLEQWNKAAGDGDAFDVIEERKRLLDKLTTFFTGEKISGEAYGQSDIEQQALYEILNEIRAGNAQQSSILDALARSSEGK